MDCPQCNGCGCDECKNGIVIVEGCPQDYCRSIAKVATLGDWIDKGLPPVAGGSLDQSAWFMEAVGLLRADEAEFRSL